MPSGLVNTGVDLVLDDPYGLALTLKNVPVINIDEHGVEMVFNAETTEADAHTVIGKILSHSALPKGVLDGAYVSPYETDPPTPVKYYMPVIRLHYHKER